MEVNCIRQAIETLPELIGRQRRLVHVCVADSEVANRTYDALDRLDAALKQEIQILVIGQFASGKTTLLNALLGEDLLFTSVLPSTAIPTELHYGAERRAIIYPRKGSWRGGNGPFEITPSPEELRKYCGWNKDDGGNPVESLFEKAEIFIPDDVLEQRVTFMETPATIPDSDYTHNQYKFDKYIRHADIVLYVVSAMRAFSFYDRECLEMLRVLLGPDLPIVFAITFSGRVTPNEKQGFVDHVHKFALQYTSVLGASAIHFIDAWDALRAKKTNDRKLLEQSGLNQLEHYLLNELCRKKNSEKIDGIIRQMEQVNVDLSIQIETQYNIDAPNDSRTSNAFRERSEELLAAQVQIELIRQELNNLVGHCE